MRILCRVALAITFALSISAQQTQPADDGTKRVDDVVAMVDAGLSEDVIIAKIRKENNAMDLTTDQLIRMKKAKVSDAIVQVMINPNAQPKSAPAMSMTAGGRGPSASGATPAPGTDAKGDPNDPMAAHDSGIYLMTKDRAGNPEMIVLERASFQGSKTGGIFATAVTHGIVKAKTKDAINGPHASIQISESSPVFYFYFDDKQAGLGKTYFGVGNLSNPNQFSLLKLEVTKTDRESTVGQFSTWGRSSGVDAKAMIPFKSERLRPGLYKVQVENLKSGEYCFIASSSNTGVQSPYGATASVMTDIFDFGATIE